MNTSEIPEEDWAAMEAIILGRPVPMAQATPIPTPSMVPIPVAHASVSTPVDDNESTYIEIRTADEFMAEQHRKGDGPCPEASAASELCQPLLLPRRQGAIGDPPALGRHQPPVRTEVAALRQELAALTRMVCEIHTRIVVGGR
jgi:hypothetical protein